MLECAVFIELPEIDDKYTSDERACFEAWIAENKDLLDYHERFQAYKADLEILKLYDQSVDQASRKRAAAQHSAPTGYVQSVVNFFRNRSGIVRTPLAQAIFEHNTDLAVSIIEKGDFDDSTQFDQKEEDTFHRYFNEFRISVLHYAIFHNEIAVVRALRRKKPQLMNASFDGMSPLNYAILLSYHYGYDRQAIALALIEDNKKLETSLNQTILLARGLRRIALALHRAGADMGTDPLTKLNVLQYLLINGCESTAIALINDGADIDFTVNNKSLLDFAISKNFWGIALALLKDKVNKEGGKIEGVKFDEAEDWATRPLLLAIWNKQTEVALTIIERSKTIEDAYGQSLLHSAIQSGLVKVARALYPKVNINGTCQTITYSQARHLDTAIDFNQSEIAIDLIKAGVEMPAGLTYYLHRAIIKGLKDVVVLLLEKGADAQAKIQSGSSDNNQLFNAFECALSCYDNTVAFQCNNNNGEVNLSENRKKLSLYAQIAAIICKHERSQDTEVLLNIKPVLHHFIFEGVYLEVAMALINEDAINIEAVYEDMTALHHAIRRNRTDIATALINKGAKLDAEFKGMTPLHHAIRENNTAVVLALIAKDPNLIQQRYVVRDPGDDRSRDNVRDALKHAEDLQDALNAKYPLSFRTYTGDNPIVAALKRVKAANEPMAVVVNTQSETSEVNGAKRRRLV